MNKEFFSEFMRDFEHISWDRQHSQFKLITGFLVALLQKPRWLLKMLVYGAKWLKLTWRDLIRARGKVEKLTFFVQNFMDAEALQQERIDACSFMVMTAQGPVSMCQHNAQRDDFILKPLDILRADGTLLRYQPLKQDASKSKHDAKLDSIAVQVV